MREYELHLGPYTYRFVFAHGMATPNEYHPASRTIVVSADLVEAAMNTDDPNALSDLYFQLFQSVLFCVARENGVELEQPDIATLSVGITEMWGQLTEHLAEWTEEVSAETEESPGDLN